MRQEFTFPSQNLAPRPALRDAARVPGCVSIGPDDGDAARAALIDATPAMVVAHPIDRVRPDIAFARAARRPPDIILTRRLERFASRVPGLLLHFTVEEVGPFSVWPGCRGRLSRIMPGLMAPDYLGREVFCCGPAPFTRAVREMRVSLGNDMARGKFPRGLPECEPMTPGQAECIDAASMAILEDVGVVFRDEVALADWRRAGGDVRGGRVHLDRGLVRARIASIPSGRTCRARNPDRSLPFGGRPPIFVPMTGAPFLRDLDDLRRWPSVADLDLFHKLGHMSPAPHSTAHHIVEPMDLKVSHRLADPVHGMDHAHQDIRISAVCPKEVNTPVLRTGFVKRGFDLDTAIAEPGKTVPLGRIAGPGDIADVILVLASGAARCMCGALVEVNGGKAVAGCGTGARSRWSRAGGAASAGPSRSA